MEKRIQVIDDHLVIAAVVVLTASEYNVLESKDKNIQKRVDAIAKDLAIKWAVEIGGNISTCAISRDFGVIVGHQEMHDMELVADKFMQAIREIGQRPAKENDEEPKCPTHEDAAEDEHTKKVEFVKLMLNDMNLPKSDSRHIVGAIIVDCSTMPMFPDITCWGHMSYDLLKEMCQLYLEANHEFEK